MFLCCSCILTQNQDAVTLYSLIWKFRSTPKSSNTGILHTECKACSEFFVNFHKFRKRSILIPSWVCFTMDLSQQLARPKLCKVQGTYRQQYLDHGLSFQNLFQTHISRSTLFIDAKLLAEECCNGAMDYLKFHLNRFRC